MEASRCAYERNVILNSVRQHNYCITQGTYIGYNLHVTPFETNDLILCIPWM